MDINLITIQTQNQRNENRPFELEEIIENYKSAKNTSKYLQNNIIIPYERFISENYEEGIIYEDQNIMISQSKISKENQNDFKRVLNNLEKTVNLSIKQNFEGIRKDGVKRFEDDIVAMDISYMIERITYDTINIKSEEAYEISSRNSKGFLNENKGKLVFNQFDENNSLRLNSELYILANYQNNRIQKDIIKPITSELIQGNANYLTENLVKIEKEDKDLYLVLNNIDKTNYNQVLDNLFSKWKGYLDLRSNFTFFNYDLKEPRTYVDSRKLLKDIGYELDNRKIDSEIISINYEDKNKTDLIFF
jgi:hypothetical protein